MKRVIVLLVLCAPLALAGCALDSIMSQMVNQVPEAVIDASPRQGHAPLTVQFDAHYSHDDGTITDYHWDFGDPHDSAPLSGLAISHTYTYPGTYLVKLTVVDDKGEMDSEKIAIVVTNPPPVANFSMSSDAPTAGDTVTFDASGSYDANGEITSYTWDFGDGAIGSGVEVTHTYAQEGYFVITLTVTDDEGETGTVRHAVNVETCTTGGTGGGCGSGGAIPLAVITGLPSCAGGTVGVPIDFDGSASRAAEGRIVRYEWNFGDGETATGVRVSHAYQRTGRFVVTLTVTDEEGRQGQASGTVSIGSS